MLLLLLFFFYSLFPNKKKKNKECRSISRSGLSALLESCQDSLETLIMRDMAISPLDSSVSLHKLKVLDLATSSGYCFDLNKLPSLEVLNVFGSSFSNSYSWPQLANLNELEISGLSIERSTLEGTTLKTLKLHRPSVWFSSVESSYLHFPAVERLEIYDYPYRGMDFIDTRRPLLDVNIYISLTFHLLFKFLFKFLFIYLFKFLFIYFCFVLFSLSLFCYSIYSPFSFSPPPSPSPYYSKFILSLPCLTALILGSGHSLKENEISKCFKRGAQLKELTITFSSPCSNQVLHDIAVNCPNLEKLTLSNFGKDINLGLIAIASK